MKAAAGERRYLLGTMSPTSRHMQRADGKTGPRPRTGVKDSEPIADRVVTNAELRRLGRWR